MTSASFKAEYAAMVRAAVADQTYPLADGFLHGVMPGYDRSWEYEMAVNSVPVDMGRRGLELAAPESFFSLYASAYYLNFTVVELPNTREAEVRARWSAALSQFPQRVKFIPNLHEAPSAKRAGADIDVIFGFRVFDNLPDDMAAAAEVRRILAHDGHIALSLAFSHVAHFEFDASGGFRVYDEQRVRQLLDGFEITAWTPLESAAQVANSPRPFDLTILHVSAKRL